MANRTISKVSVNRERFYEVLKFRRSSIRKLGNAYNEIQRTEKTIRRCLENGEMPPDLLDRIARYLNIHPDYISGKLDEEANQIEDDILRHIFLKHLKPENYPYLIKAKEQIEYEQLFEKILTWNDISLEQLKALGPDERVLLRQELVVAILEVLEKHFKVDAFGKSLSDELNYCLSQVHDVDPISYFAELEGIADEVKYDTKL